MVESDAGSLEGYSVVILFPMFSLYKTKLNNSVHGLRNYQKTQKKDSDNVFSGTGPKNGGI